MPSSPKTLHDVLAGVLDVQADADGVLTARRNGTVASLRVVTIAEGLDLVSITQMLAWDLELTEELRKRVGAQTNSTMLGTVALSEQPGGIADVLMRYNFPAAALAPDALRTLVLMVLDTGVGVRRALTG